MASLAGGSKDQLPCHILQLVGSIRAAGESDAQGYWKWMSRRSLQRERASAALPPAALQEVPVV